MEPEKDLTKKTPGSLLEMDFKILCELEGEEFAKKALFLGKALNEEELVQKGTIN